MLAGRLTSIMRQNGAPKLGAKLGAKIVPVTSNGE